MIRRLEISGLVVIESADLELGPGLVTITGETGAGKSVLIQSLNLLAGAPADPSLVRPGHGHALVQATLQLPDRFWDGLADDDPAGGLRDLLEDESEVVVARRIPAEGRARAFIDGQAAAAPAVGALVRHAVRFSGQGDQYRLLSAPVQMSILDAYAGPGAQADAQRMRDLRRELVGLDSELADLDARRVAFRERMVALTALVEDAGALAGSAEELDGLRRDRERMRNADALASAASAAIRFLSPDDGQGARDLVGEARAALDAQAQHDRALAPITAHLVTAQEAMNEAALELRSYADTLDADPERLRVTEDRIAQFVDVERRHGVPIAELGEAVDRARAELDEAAQALSADALTERRQSVLADALSVADRLHTLRTTAAARLGHALADEFGTLAMPEASLRIEVERSRDEVPVDSCVFWFRANPGMPESRLSDAASGGELSRVLLALHVVAQGASDATWVFDEVDAGIGGGTANAVASRLASMAEGGQAIAITHLPAIAAAADQRFRLIKSVETDVTTTHVERLSGDEVEDELVRMLGGEAGGAREHARALLERFRA